MSSIPRFLLPQARQVPLVKPNILFLRRQFTSSSHQSAKVGKPPATTPAPRTLAKPTRYVPPSHPTGDRRPSSNPLPRKPHVPQRTRYPGTMPEHGTWHHWILHSRGLHGMVTLTILVSLAVYVSVQNFLITDPACHQVFWDWLHPIASIKSFVAAYRESDRANTARIMAKRKKLSEDIERRAHYRYVVEGKSGGDEEGFGGWALRRSPKDEALGWGVMIDGKRVDELIAEREQEKKEKAKREKEVEDRKKLGIDEDVVTITAKNVEEEVKEKIESKTGEVVYAFTTVEETADMQPTPQEMGKETKKKTSFLWW